MYPKPLASPFRERPSAKGTPTSVGPALCIGLVLAFGCIGAAVAADPAPTHPPTSRVPGSQLEDRVKMFAKALDLDASQQSQLRKILLGQRETVRKIWRDPSLSPAERAPATRAANERTGDEIREILNDEQRQKYNTAVPAVAADQADQRRVEQWLDAKPRQSQE
jgi:Spy/CpxP family protein refolding chaperone